MFFLLRQNNSYGVYEDIDQFSAVYLAIETDREYDAIDIAIDNGVYFRGVERGIDCPCCGDRWYNYFERFDRLPTKHPLGVGESLVIFEDGSRAQFVFEY